MDKLADELFSADVVDKETRYIVDKSIAEREDEAIRLARLVAYVRRMERKEIASGAAAGARQKQSMRRRTYTYDASGGATVTVEYMARGGRVTKAYDPMRKSLNSFRVHCRDSTSLHYPKPYKALRRPEAALFRIGGKGKSSKNTVLTLGGRSRRGKQGKKVPVKKAASKTPEKSPMKGSAGRKRKQQNSAEKVSYRRQYSSRGGSQRGRGYATRSTRY